MDDQMTADCSAHMVLLNIAMAFNDISRTRVSWRTADHGRLQRDGVSARILTPLLTNDTVRLELMIFCSHVSSVRNYFRVGLSLQRLRSSYQFLHPRIALCRYAVKTSVCAY